jgi:hypothetical protein
MNEANNGHILYIVRTWVPEDMLDEWNDWYDNVHIPGVLALPQIQRVWKHRVADDSTPQEWQPQYVTVYQLNSWDDWVSYRDSEARASLMRDYADRYGKVGKVARQVLVQVGEMEGSHQPTIGQSI